MYEWEWITVPLNAWRPAKAGMRGFQWWPVQAMTASNVSSTSGSSFVWYRAVFKRMLGRRLKWSAYKLKYSRHFGRERRAAHSTPHVCVRFHRSAPGFPCAVRGASFVRPRVSHANAVIPRAITSAAAAAHAHVCALRTRQSSALAFSLPRAAAAVGSGRRRRRTCVLCMNGGNSFGIKKSEKLIISLLVLITVDLCARAPRAERGAGEMRVVR